MDTRPANSLLLVATLVLPACYADSLSAPSLQHAQDGGIAAQASAAPLRVASPRPLPLRGVCEGTSTIVTGFEPPLLHQVATAVCRVSHLGRVRVVNVQQINIATGEQSGQATWTTSTGEELYLTSLGAATPTGGTTFRFTGLATINGGTGRFSDAQGTLHVAGTGDAATGTASFTYDGTITYDARAGCDALSCPAARPNRQAR